VAGVDLNWNDRESGTRLPPQGYCFGAFSDDEPMHYSLSSGNNVSQKIVKDFTIALIFLLEEIHNGAHS
jgi:hypothetical protein